MNKETKEPRRKISLQRGRQKNKETHAEVCEFVDSHKFAGSHRSPSPDSHKFAGSHRSLGFTLVEVLIATLLFTVIMIIGTGAVLETNAVHKKTQTMRAVIDNLHFIMEDMARNIRLGSEYRCSETNDIPNTSTNCQNGVLIAFKPFDATDETGQVVYRLFKANPGSKWVIQKKGKDDSNFSDLTPKEVTINFDESGFNVYGALAGSEDKKQPRALIRLSGYVEYKDIKSPFNIQTTVSQRLLDI